MSLAAEISGKTDIGCIRRNNEDNLGWDQRVCLYVVCALAGEVASKMGVDLMLGYFREGKDTGNYPEFGEAPADMSAAGRQLLNAIRRANAAIYEAGQAKESQQGMGSTVVAALLQENFLTIAHAGDSRIYRLRNGVLEQLTQDHSLVMEQVRRGLISMEEAEKSEMQNIIIRALGSEEAVEPDIQELIALRGDVYLLATDGLTKLVKENVIKTILENSPSLDTACEDLIKAAKEKGGDDNITCLLLRVVEVPWYQRFLNFLLGGGQSWQNSS